MYKPLLKGGKAVPHIEVKLKAMFLIPIIKACLHMGKGLTWSFFCKLVGGSQSTYGVRQKTIHECP